MKKILFIITQSEFGGAQRFLAHLIDGLRRDTQISVLPKAQNQRVSANHYEIVVAAGPEGDDKAGVLYALEKKGINTSHLKYLRRDINPLFDLLGLFEIKKLIKKEKPDVVFLCSSKAGVLGSLAAHLCRRNTRIDLASQDTQIHAEADNKKFLYSDITYKIRGACFKVWKQFRGAFKEKIIENALMTELENYGLKIETQKRIPISYKGKKVGVYVPDAIVNDKVLIELKSKPRLTKEDQKQFWLYLKGSKYKLGLLINFGKQLEIKRKVYDTARNNSASISVLPEAQNQRVSAVPPKVVYRIGGWAFNDPRSFLSKAIYKWIEKFSAKWKDIIIVNSEHDRKQAVELKIKPRQKILTIYNGIDISKLEFLPKEKAREKIFNRRNTQIASKRSLENADTREKSASISVLPEASDQRVSAILLVGCITNLYPAKGLEYLIEAANILSRRNAQIIPRRKVGDTQKHPSSINPSDLTTGHSAELCINQRKSACLAGGRAYSSEARQNQRVSATIKFVVIGEGQKRAELERLIEKYDLRNNFFLIGAIPNAYKYLKAFDIFVLPSVKEGFPWTILEAMAAEVPIVATKVAAIPEIMENGKTSLLVDSGKPEQLAGAIERLVNNKDLGRKLAKYAREEVERKYSLQKMINELQGVL